MVTTLWQAHSEKVFHYINKRIRNREVARDLVQDTFQKVLTNSEQLEKVDNPESWIYRIARNTLIDHTRKKKELGLEETVIPDEKENDYSKEQLVESIATCLHELLEEYESEHKEVLLDVFSQSLSQKEASQYLNVPYSTLKSRIQKAREEILNEFNARCCRLQRNRSGEIIGCVPVGAEAPVAC